MLDLPGNYSTGLPEKQDRSLSAQEELLSQSTKLDGGVNVYTGMNDAGDFYIGNKKVILLQVKNKYLILLFLLLQVKMHLRVLLVLDLMLLLHLK